MFVIRYISSFLIVSLGELRSVMKSSTGDSYDNSSHIPLQRSTQARTNSNRNLSPSILIRLNDTTQNSSDVRSELLDDGQIEFLNRINERSSSREVASFSRQSNSRDASFNSIEISAAVA